MTKRIALTLAGIFVASSLFIATAAVADEIGTRNDLIYTSQNNGQFDRDLSYSNPDYKLK